MKTTLHRVFNEAKKNGTQLVKRQLNNSSFVDEGEGLITFPNGLTITDDSKQFDGTSYDISTMTLDEFSGKLTADHEDGIQKVLGTVNGIRKVGNKVTIQSIQFAVKEHALAVYAYNMLKGKYLTDFSTETMGPWPDPDGIFYNASVVGLSLVVYGNNKSAAINKLALNSVEEAKKIGLDTTLFEKNYVCYEPTPSVEQKNKKEETQMKRKIKNSRGFNVVVKFKNDAGVEETVTVKHGETVEVPLEQGDAVQSQVDEATEPKVEKEPAKQEPAKSEDVGKAVENALAPLLKKVNDLEQKVFDNSAQEPQFHKVNAQADRVSTGVSKELTGMNYRERHGLQINAAWEMLKDHNQKSGDKLRTINQFHLEKLQEKGIVTNSVTLGDFGNFVISPELLTEMEGFRSNFNPLISKLNFRETLSLQMAWLKRSGDINMSEVEMCDDGANGNLKPISEYGAEIATSNLHELAAVTPVCNAATRFLAADLLGDVAAGYRNDFDRKRAQLFIARLQQAVNSTGNTSSYATTSALAALQSFITLASTMQENVMGGYYIMSQKSYWELVRMEMAAGISTDSGFRIFTTGDAGPLLLGVPYIIVPNELLPTLNSAETRSFVVEGVTVTINQAVFYVDLNTFSGRTSGGLNYDLSTEAAYEENSIVKSAFQRNELVLRGSFFRGGAIRDEDKVTGLGSRGVS